MPAIGYGRQTTGLYVPDPMSIQASHPFEWKVGGLTLDWSTVPTLGSDYVDSTIEKGLTVLTGSRMLRYGTFLARITSAEVNTLSMAGTPTGGTFTVTVVVNGQDPQTTPAQAYNVSASNLLAALLALSNVGAGNMTVTRAGTTGADFVWTVSGAGDLATADLTITTNGTLLTGGSGMGVTVATTHAGGNYGMFGPADSTATDGRQTWTNGNVFLVPSTILYDNPAGAGMPGAQNVHMGAVSGGPVYEARLLFGSAAPGTHGPARTDMPTCMPRLELV